MFMRFYGTPRDVIESTIATMKAAHPEIGEVTYGPIERSVNPFLPPGENTEVNLEFADSDAELAFYQDEEMQQLYMSVMAPSRDDAEFVLRTPEDAAFNVG